MYWLATPALAPLGNSVEAISVSLLAPEPLAAVATSAPAVDVSAVKKARLAPVEQEAKIKKPPLKKVEPQKMPKMLAPKVAARPSAISPTAKPIAAAKGGGVQASNVVLPVVAAVYEAAYLNNPKPAYPSIARRLNEEGRVLLRVHVSAQGLPLVVNVQESSGFSRLDEAARKTVQRWSFVPAKRGSEAIPSWVDVPIQFSLNP